MRRAVIRRWVIEVLLTSNEPWLWLNLPSTKPGEYQPSAFDTWLTACETAGILESVNLAAGMRKTYSAVKAAFTSPHSNGQTESQVNRLKLLKRQMYGRANLDLLRLRSLHPA
jgi:transposase